MVLRFLERRQSAGFTPPPPPSPSRSRSLRGHGSGRSPTHICDSAQVAAAATVPGLDDHRSPGRLRDLQVPRRRRWSEVRKGLADGKGTQSTVANRRSSTIDGEIRFQIEAKTFRFHQSGNRLLQVGEIRGRREYRFWINSQIHHWICCCLLKALKSATTWKQDFKAGDRVFIFSLEANCSGFYARIHEKRLHGDSWVIIPEGDNRLGFRFFLSELQKCYTHLHTGLPTHMECFFCCGTKRPEPQSAQPGDPSPSALIFEAELMESGLWPLSDYEAVKHIQARKDLAARYTLTQREECTQCDKGLGVIYPDPTARGTLLSDIGRHSEEAIQASNTAPSGQRVREVVAENARAEDVWIASFGEASNQPRKGDQKLYDAEDSLQGGKLQKKLNEQETIAAARQAPTVRIEAGQDSGRRQATEQPPDTPLLPVQVAEKTREFLANSVQTGAEKHTIGKGELTRTINSSKLELLLSAQLGSLSAQSCPSSEEACPLHREEVNRTSGALRKSDTGPPLISPDSRPQTQANAHSRGSPKQVNGGVDGLHAFKRMATMGLKNFLNAGRTYSSIVKDFTRSDQGKQPPKSKECMLNVNAAPFEPKSNTIEESSLYAAKDPELDEVGFSVLEELRKPYKGKGVLVEDLQGGDGKEEDEAIDDTIIEHQEDIKIFYGGKAKKTKKSKKKRR